MNPLVERVAQQLYVLRHGKRTPWAKLAERTRQGHREIVREVMLAVCDAGLIIREWAPLPLLNSEEEPSSECLAELEQNPSRTITDLES